MNTSPRIFSHQTPQTYYILVALYGRTLTAYDICHYVKQDSSASVIIAPNSMHHALKRLLDRRFIEVRNDGPRPRYALTTSGRRALTAELGRLKHDVWAGEWALAGRTYAKSGTLEI